MEHCKKCGQVKKKNGEHICSASVWNKGKKGLQVAWNKGKSPSPETKQKISDSLKGNKSWNKGLKGKQKAWNKGVHINLNPEGSFKKGQNIGIKNVNWKSGVTPLREKERKTVEVKLWRKSCFERDNFTCAKYGVRTGGLVVHHINNFAEFPELRTSIENGITLSEKAHKEFHKKYGFRNNSRQQLEEYLKNK